MMSGRAVVSAEFEATRFARKLTLSSPRPPSLGGHRGILMLRWCSCPSHMFVRRHAVAGWSLNKSGHHRPHSFKSKATDTRQPPLSARLPSLSACNWLCDNLFQLASGGAHGGPCDSAHLDGVRAENKKDKICVLCNPCIFQSIRDDAVHAFSNPSATIQSMHFSVHP